MSLLSGLFKSGQHLDLTGITDWHSHILPGVDDGVRSMDESLEILERYENAGIKKLWLTPHIMEDVPNGTSSLKKRFEELKQHYHGTVELHLAAENMIDNLFLQRLESDDLLPIGEDGKTLLVETSYFSAPFGFHDTLDTIKSKGFTPLLAHPERYNYINSPAEYIRLKDQGVKFQLNAMSIGGYYGPAVRDKAMELLKEGMYDRVGSDIHRVEHFDIMTRMKLSRETNSLLNRILQQP